MPLLSVTFYPKRGSFCEITTSCLFLKKRRCSGSSGESGATSPCWLTELTVSNQAPRVRAGRQWLRAQGGQQNSLWVCRPLGIVRNGGPETRPVSILPVAVQAAVRAHLLRRVKGEAQDAPSGSTSTEEGRTPEKGSWCEDFRQVLVTRPGFLSIRCRRVPVAANWLQGRLDQPVLPTSYGEFSK